MKKIIIIMISLIWSAGAFAQQKGFAQHHVHVYTRVYVAPAYRLGFSYGYPYFGYPYFGYPYGFAPYPYTPPASYRLNAQINAVKSDYRYQIKAVKKDKSISGNQKKLDILQLKSAREKAIAQAEKSYYNRRMNSMNHQPGTNNNQGQPKENSNS